MADAPRVVTDRGAKPDPGRRVRSSLPNRERSGLRHSSSQLALELEVWPSTQCGRISTSDTSTRPQWTYHLARQVYENGVHPLALPKQRRRH